MILQETPMSRFDHTVDPLSAAIYETHFEVAPDTLENCLGFAKDLAIDIVSMSDDPVSPLTAHMDDDDIDAIEYVASSLRTRLNHGQRDLSFQDRIRVTIPVDRVISNIGLNFRDHVNMDHVQIAKMNFEDYVTDVLDPFTMESDLSPLIGQVPQVVSLDALPVIGTSLRAFPKNISKIAEAVLLFPFFTNDNLLLL